MRTRLLRTFYPSPAIEPDTGSAANDEPYANPSLVVLSTANREPPVGTAHTRNDDYQLGGYAGI